MERDFKKIEEKINKLSAATTRGFAGADKKIADLAVTINTLAKATTQGFEGMAIMVQRGFEETATKTELNAVESRLSMRLDRIENILLRDHNNRIERIDPVRSRGRTRIYRKKKSRDNAEKRGVYSLTYLRTRPTS